MTTKLDRTRTTARLGLPFMLAGSALLALAVALGAWAVEPPLDEAPLEPAVVAARADAPSFRSSRPVQAPICRAEACTSPAPAPTHTASAARPAAAALPSTQAPLSALLDTDSDVARTLQAAWEGAVADCMQARGLHYVPPGEAGEANPNDELLAAMSAQQRTAWQTALHGALPEDDKPQPADERAVLDVTDDVSMAWSPHGCAALADRKLYGDDALYRNLHMQLTLMREQAQARADHDPDYARGLQDYARCMGQRGQTVPASILTGEDSLDEGSEGPDADCQQHARLPERRRMALAQAEQDLAERNQSDLIAYRELQEDALAAYEEP